MSNKKSDIAKKCRDIAKLRQGNDMTQAELANLMGVSMRTVSGWETGDRPPKDIGKLLALIEEKLLSAEAGNTAHSQQRKESEEVWKDKYIEQLELNLQLQKDILELKDQLLKKPTTLKKKSS